MWLEFASQEDNYVSVSLFNNIRGLNILGTHVNNNNTNNNNVLFFVSDLKIVCYNNY